MNLIMGNKVYKMTIKQKKSVLSIASRMIKKGIYAVEKQGSCELLKERYYDDAELKKAVAEYKENGFKVYYNE